jgi:hypothetical protein
LALGDELSDAVVDVIGDPFSLVVLGGDDLLDERGEGALAPSPDLRRRPGPT